MKLEGSLDTFPLRELIDMAVYSSMTGVINIFTPGEPGYIYFRDGTLYHVGRGQSSGIDALAELFEHGTCNFAVVSDVTCDDESLWGALSQHLQTAERLATRWRMVRPYVPHLKLIPALLTSREAAHRRIGPAHQPVLGAIDGQCSLQQITESTGWAEIDVAEAIVQMSVDGLVELRTQRAVAEPAATPCVETTSNGRGIFDRLRNRPHGPAAHQAGQPEPTRLPTSEADTQRLSARTPEPDRTHDSTPEELILQLLRG